MVIKRHTQIGAIDTVLARGEGIIEIAPFIHFVQVKQNQREK